MKKVFISHSSKDKTFARKLQIELFKYPIDVWLDENKLQIGDSLAEVFKREIVSSTDFIVLISEASNASKWVRKEVEFAFSQSSVNVLPILIEHCNVDERFSGLKYLNFTNQDDFTFPFNDLLTSLALVDREIKKPTITNIKFYDIDPELNPNATPINKFKKRVIFPRYIYMSWEAIYFNDGVIFKRKWYKNSEVIPSLIREDTWDSIWRKKGKITSTFIFNRYGHGKGEYAVRFYIIEEDRERYITSASFEIL
jgi:hypothetical protein